MLKSVIPISIIFLLSLITLGCGENSSEPTILAVDEQVDITWVESLTIQLLNNDTVPKGTIVEIVTNAIYGEVIIDGSEAIYTPKKRQQKVDEFSYRLLNGDKISNIATVKITLRNAVIGVASNTSIVVENEPHTISISTLLPVAVKQVNLVRNIDDVRIDKQFLNLIPGETNHSFQIEVNDLQAMDTLESSRVYQIIVQADDEEYYLNRPIFNLPKHSQLLTSLKRAWYNEPEARRVIDNNLFALTWTSFEPWVMPVDKTWIEDPYSSLTWQLYYHSLGWLHAAEYRYDENNSSELISYIENTIMDYVHSVPRDEKINFMSWNDHTVAWRGEVLTYFYIKYLQESLSAKHRDDFLKYMEEHILELLDLLDDPRFIAHNHNMFHAISLYNMSFVFIDIAEKYNAREHALKRIEELLSEMVNPLTGVSVEQSINYQLGALELFADALENIHNLSGQNLYDQTLVFQRMIDFTLHFAFDTGGAPAMGDSNFDNKNYLDRLIAAANKVNVSTPYLEYIKGNNGLPREHLYESSEDGYVILRTKSTHVFADFGKKLFSHGHQDQGNVTFALDSDEILIDSGGPYQYDRELRKYFRSPYAHNTLVVNESKQYLNDAQIIDSGCITGICFVLGRISESEYNHMRLIISDDQASLYIYDDVQALEQQKYELVFNLHPNIKSIQSDITENIFSLTTNKANKYYLGIQSNINLTSNQYRGIDDDNMVQGWVQPKFGLKIPTTSIIYSALSTDFTALSVLINSESLLKDINYQVDEDNVTINLVGKTFILNNVHGDKPIINVIAQ